MLKKIKFSFTIDPQQLAVVLAHAGKLDIDLMTDAPEAEKPRALGRRKMLALPPPKKNGGPRVSKNGKTSMGIVLEVLAKGPRDSSDIRLAFVRNGYVAGGYSAAVAKLVEQGKVKRVAPHKYALIDYQEPQHG